MSPDEPVFDDAAIERGVEAMTCSFRDSAGRVQAYFPSPDAVRAIVEAVLTPPPEPEIDISDYVAHAGWTVLHKLGFKSPSPRDGQMAARDVYRAMERERLRTTPAEPVAQPVRQMHRRSTDPQHWLGTTHERQCRRVMLPVVDRDGKRCRLHARESENLQFRHRRKGDA